MMAATLLKFGPKTVKVTNTLNEYQQHKEVHTYKPFRYLGFFVSLGALGFGFFALVNRNWMRAELAGRFLFNFV